MRPEAGFTLIELIVVLVVMALASALAIPLVYKALATAEVSGAVRQLSSGLRYARSQAITNNRETVFMVDVEKRNYGVGTGAVMATVAESLDLTLVTAESERLSDELGGVRFFPNGTSTGGRIDISDGLRTYSVAVDWLTGRVSIQE